MAVYSMESTQENCYPGSTVLVNKFGLTDKNKLDIVERQIVLLKGTEIERNAVFENVDFNYYKSIHKQRFHRSIIKRTAFFAVRKYKAHSICGSHVIGGSILRTKITVKNNVFGIVTAFPGFFKSGNNKRSVHFSSVAVSHDFSSANIENTSKIGPAVLNSVDICNVRKP